MTALPMDPYDVEQLPPTDLHDCSRCHGQGLIEVLVLGALVDRPCPACAGTGEVA